MGVRHVRLALLAAVIAVLAVAQPAAARDATVHSFDGTPIVTHFFPAPGASAGDRKPTVLLGHGWGGSGATDPEASQSKSTQGGTGVGDLRRAGFNVLTWDARGFGGSGGSASVDGPDFEGRDVQALIGYIAGQPEARLDRPGDPRLGMAGGSYAGGIQLVTAGIDRRVDAIVPDIAWQSLVTSLFKHNSIKEGWGLLLGGAGAPTTALPGVFSPAGVQAGTLDPHVTSALVQGAGLGTVSAANQAWFASRGPGALVRRIRVPTLLTQGTVDTLFTLQEAINNFSVLRADGVRVKMMWHCGGHGTCNLPAGEPGHVERATIAWLKRFVARDRSVSVGPQFEWVADDGRWRSSASYPLARRTGLRATKASATLAISPADSASGSPIAAGPATNAVNVGLPRPRAGINLLGPPRVSFTYRGTAAPASTFVYGQLVDETTNQVVGNQATPLPVKLDGATHRLSLPLEAIAVRTNARSRYRLQVTGGTLLYGTQRSTGTVTFSKLAMSLPAGAPTTAAASKRCLARRAPLGPRGIGRIRLGRTRARLRRLSVKPRRRTPRTYRYCAKRSRGRVVAVFSGRRARSRARLITSTAKLHRMRRVGRGASTRRLAHAFPRKRRIARGLYRAAPGSRRIFGTRHGKVRFAGVADRRLLRHRRALRGYLRKAGL